MDARFAFSKAPWYFDLNHDWWDPAPAQAIAHLTRLFENPEPALDGFADRQIAQGLTYLVNTMASGDSGWFYSTEVPVKERIRGVEVIVPFFERLFKPRCTPHLSHLSEVDAGPLNGVCYMWWDVFPSLALADDPNLPILHDAALSTMERILHLDSLACQESALHGLGHWQPEYEERVAGQWIHLKWDLAFAAVAFLVLLPFYALGWMGGGDVKMLALAFLWTGSSGALPFAIFLALFSGAHGLAAKLGWVKSQETPSGRRRIPLAPSVAAALIGTFMLRSLHMA